MGIKNERLLWVGLMILSLIIGVWLGGEKYEDSLAGQSHESPRSSRSQTASSRNHAHQEYMRARRDTTSVDDALDETRLALKMSKKTERCEEVMQMLGLVTVENWRPMWKEFVKATINGGRVHDMEWMLFMNRVGEVAGMDAMVYFEKNGQPEHMFNRIAVMQGWAVSEPQMALDWMKSQPAEDSSRVLWNSMLEGIAQTNPDMAFEVLDSLSKRKDVSVNMHSVFEGSVQAGGVSNAIRILESRLESLQEGNTPDMVSIELRSFIKRRLGRMDWLATDFPELHEGNQQDISHLDDYFESPAAKQE